jgi:hypothetical protein
LSRKEVTDYKYGLCDIPEDGRSHLNLGGNLKTLMDFCTLLQSATASPPAEVKGKIVNPATEAGKVSGIESILLCSCFRNNDSSPLLHFQCL